MLPAPQARLAILIAALTYREIGMVIADRGFDVWSGRAYTTKTQKWLIAFKGMVTFLFSKKPHQYQGFHDPALHRGLSPDPGSTGLDNMDPWVHIIGGGLSGLSLASSLATLGKLPGKVIVSEPNLDALVSKTFSFWFNAAEQIS